MKVAFFDTHRFEKPYFEKANEASRHEIRFLEPRLTPETAILADGADAVCAFTNDRLGRTTLEILKKQGVRLIALRCAGFNHVDLVAAREKGIRVVRVPAYSPNAVAEHAVALILALNRKIPRASARVHEHNFSLDGLVGFDLHGKTAGVVGTGRIGAVLCSILRGFGCKVLAHDLAAEPELVAQGVQYVPLDEIWKQSDIVSLHVPLTPETRHLVSAQAIEKMKPGVMLINTGRGGLVDSRALVEGLKSGKIGAAGLDVYEEEEKFFFRDLSEEVLQDDVLALLLTFPNVLITAHQAFLTQEALLNIAVTTVGNLDAFARGVPLENEITPNATNAISASSSPSPRR